MRTLAGLALLLCLPPGEGSARDPIDAFFGRLDSVVKPIDRYPGGVVGLAKSLGGDRAKVRELLATLDFEPYAGVMKGPEGTLLTGAGNSFDQALLAAALLSPSKVRFAVGDAPLEKVRERFLARAPARPAPPADGLKAQVDWKAVREDKAAVWALVDAEVAELSRLLEGKGVRLESPPATLDATWCWVEVETDGKWEPLVEPPCAAKERFDRVPDAWFHRIEVYARLERFDGAKLAVDEILKVSYPSAELFGRPLTFRIVPAPGQPGLGKSLVGKEGLKRNPLEALRAAKIFTPSVQLGRAGQYGRPFDLEGKLYSIDPAKGFAVEGFQAAGNRVGALLGGRKPAPGPPTGVWWGVRRNGPGTVAQSWEREIVDLIGFGKPRRKIDRLDPAQTERLLLGFFAEHDVHLDYGGLSLAEGLLRLRRSLEPFRGFFRELRAFKEGKRSLEQALRAFEVEEQIFTAFQVMRTTFRKELDARFKARSWAPAPGVAVVHAGVVDAAGGKLKLRETFDLMDLPRSIEGPDAARYCLALGVLDTELELQTCDCNPPMYNTASMVRRAKAELRCLTKPEEADALAFKETARERVKAELRAGHAVLAPAAEIDGEACWWRVDPRTGSALGIGETGCGQTSVEYWMEVHDRIKETYGIGKVLYCYLMAIWTNPITPNELTGEGPGLDVIKEILKCIPVCKGLKKIIKFPEDEDPFARFGFSMEAEARVDAHDLCKEGEKWLDANVFGSK